MTDGLPATFDVRLVHAFDVRMTFHKRVVFGPLPKTSTGNIQKFLLRDRAHRDGESC